MIMSSELNDPEKFNDCTSEVDDDAIISVNEIEAGRSICWITHWVGI